MRFSLLSSTLILFSAFLHPKTVVSYLSVQQRWIVNETGQRVKLACANWPSHMEPMVTEGLSKQPLDTISKSIASMGFNCVRLTWPVDLFAGDSSANVHVNQSFRNLGLNESVDGIQLKNPGLLGLTLREAYKAVVSNLAENNIMVILDNHVSKPGWCCSNDDGNGFFGDEYFDPDTWIKGLTQVATTFIGFTNVIGMSLRNELRGSGQNDDDWYRYMQLGADAVHFANPNVLVILSGLKYNNDLSFLAERSPDIQRFSSKLVFELHWYGFYTDKWEKGTLNDVCAAKVATVMTKAGFLVDNGWPLFMSEWGVDQRGTNVNDNRFLSCIIATLAELDLDWAIWGLQGSYYLREGTRDVDEVYGMLSFDWSKPRNPSFLQRIAALQSPFQGPHITKPYRILFHPSTGLCAVTETSGPSFRLGPCSKSAGFTYTERKFKLYEGTSCLKVSGEGKQVNIGSPCNDSGPTWDFISDSKMHISSQESGLCLDIGSDGSSIVTNSCKCLSKDTDCDPESQWFKMVTTGTN